MEKIYVSIINHLYGTHENFDLFQQQASKAVASQQPLRCMHPAATMKQLLAKHWAQSLKKVKVIQMQIAIQTIWWENRWRGFHFYYTSFDSMLIKCCVVRSLCLAVAKRALHSDKKLFYFISCYFMIFILVYLYFKLCYAYITFGSSYAYLLLDILLFIEFFLFTLKEVLLIYFSSHTNLFIIIFFLIFLIYSAYFFSLPHLN